MVGSPASTSSFWGRSAEVTAERLTLAPVCCWNVWRSSSMVACSSSASEMLKVMVVPESSPCCTGSGPPPQAVATKASPRRPEKIRLCLLIHSPPVPRGAHSRAPGSPLSPFHSSGQRAGPEVPLEEVHDQQDGQGQHGRHRGHRLLASPVDGLEHLKRQRVLVRGEQPGVHELVPRVEPDEQRRYRDPRSRQREHHAHERLELGRSVDGRRLL